MPRLMTTLGDVFDRVDGLSKHCTDEIVPVRDISFDSLESVNIGTEAHPMREVAQREFSTRLGIPYQYLARCPLDVQAFNLNHWIRREKNDELFFRFDGEDVRAVFTTKYKPVDNFEILERLDSLGHGPDTQVQCHLDAQFMLLNIPDGRDSFTVNGDRLTPGISISNSEVGLASLSIAAFLLRLVCTNGMISKTQISASFRHVSRKILEGFPEALEKVASELGETRYRIKISLESQVENPLMTIESFNRQFQLGKPEKEAVEWAWPLESGETMFHVLNTYTRAAQREGLSAESSYRLQKVGGSVLGMLN